MERTAGPISCDYEYDNFKRQEWRDIFQRVQGSTVSLTDGQNCGTMRQLGWKFAVARARNVSSPKICQMVCPVDVPQA